MLIKLTTEWCIQGDGQSAAEQTTTLVRDHKHYTGSTLAH